MTEHDEVKDVATEPEKTTALTRAEAGALQAFGEAESYALADLTTDQFGQLVKRMKLHDARMREIKESLMEYDVHYGVPGKKKEKLKPGEKPGIYKPGVETLLGLFGLVADVQIEMVYGDPKNETGPAIICNARALIHRGSLDGPVIAVGVASRNSWEVKYRWRNVGRVCPACGEAALMVSKFVKDSGEFKGMKPWWCNTNRNGCGSEFAPDDARIKSQDQDKIPNSDAYDLALTLAKMAAKAARADGTITATRSSNLWTQDLEDMSPSQRAAADAGSEDEIVGQMYGGDPDAWREQASKPEPKATPATAPGQSPPDAASAKQLEFIATLSKRKFANLDAFKAWCKKLGHPETPDKITKARAMKMIADLKTQPDADAQADPARATAAQIDKMLQRLKDLLREKEQREQGYKAFDIREGVWFIVGPEELGQLGEFEHDEIQLDYLRPEQMIELGTYLAEQSAN